MARLPVSRVGIVLHLTSEAPASCDDCSFCELFSAFERVATKCEVHDNGQSRHGSNRIDEKRRVIVRRAAEPDLSTLDNWQDETSAPSQLGSRSKGGIISPLKEGPPTQHLTIYFFQRSKTETEEPNEIKGENRSLNLYELLCKERSFHLYGSSGVQFAESRRMSSTTVCHQGQKCRFTDGTNSPN